MAAMMQSLRLAARASAIRIPSGVRRSRPVISLHAKHPNQIQHRSLNTTRPRLADDDRDGHLEETKETPEELARRVYDGLIASGAATEEDREAYVQLVTTAESEFEASGDLKRLDQQVQAPERFLLRDWKNQSDLDEDDEPDYNTGVQEMRDVFVESYQRLRPELRPKPGFFAEEEGAEDPDEDDEFEPDDITTTAHMELEQVRELREFARVAAYDMPLLHEHIKPFQPPTAAQPLRFRYTTYLGETHPASRKVVMDFKPSALPNLTDVQRAKLIKLLGPRYDPTTGIAKMGCELQATAMQNKRHLADTLDSMLKECREGKDTFEDVPFDFRYQRRKKRFAFPEDWKMSEERRQQLDMKRAERKNAEQDQQISGQTVDGTLLIEEMLAPRATPQGVPVMANAQTKRSPRTRLA